MLADSQLVAFKAAILAETDPTFVGYRNEGATGLMAEWFNQPSNPVFVVWRTEVPTKDCKNAMVWTEYLSRSQAERDAWQFMLSNGIINAADINIRQGIADIFSGPNAVNTRNNLLAIAKRVATRGEKVFASGVGNDATPGTLVFEGWISDGDVIRALGV